MFFCINLILMNWKILIEELLAMGWSEGRIAKRITEMGCSISQASIHRLKVGNIKEPRYEFGAALIEMHQQETCKDKAAT